MYYYKKFSHQTILMIYLQKKMLHCMFYICGLGLKQDKCLPGFACFLEMFTQRDSHRLYPPYYPSDANVQICNDQSFHRI